MIRRSAILAATLLLAACGGGDDDPAIEVPDVETGPTEDAAPEPEAGDGGDLTELAGAWAQTSAKVSYELVSGTTPSQTMTLYWRPPDSWRMDITGAGAETIIISTDTGGFVCTGAAGTAQCVQTPSDVSTQSPIPFAGLFSSPEGILDDIESQTGGAEIVRSSATVAGVDARCFAAAGPSGRASGGAEWCFSRDGILLRYAAGGAGAAGFSMEATEVDRRVRASDFEPPYPITEIPTG